MNWSFIFVRSVIVATFFFFFFAFLSLFRFILVLELFKMVKTNIITNNFAIHSLQFGISVRLSIYRFLFCICCCKAILMGTRHRDAVSVYKIAFENRLEKKNIYLKRTKIKLFFSIFFRICCYCWFIFDISTKHFIFIDLVDWKMKSTLNGIKIHLFSNVVHVTAFFVYDFNFNFNSDKNQWKRLFIRCILNVFFSCLLFLYVVVVHWTFEFDLIEKKNYSLIIDESQSHCVYLCVQFQLIKLKYLSKHSNMKTKKNKKQMETV